MAITTEQIKQLRDETGISVMQCKKALEETGGDKEKAIIILRKQGAKTAEKKAGRSLGAGVIGSYVHAGDAIGAMVVLSCETDFVAKNEEFKTLARDIAMQVAAMSPKWKTMDEISENDKKAAKEVFEGEVKGKPEEIREKILEGKLNSYFKEQVLMEQPFIKNPEITIGDLVKSCVQKFGERTEPI